MREILLTNDPVVLSFARSLLDDAGVGVFVADTSMSVLEGSIGVFPRRLMVLAEEWDEAHRVLSDGGLASWLLAA